MNIIVKNSIIFSLLIINYYNLKTMFCQEKYALNIYTMRNRKRSRYISTAKTITWRVIASLDTFLLSWLVSGSATIGMSIASLEILTKMLLYYFHERQWEKPRVVTLVERCGSRLDKYFKKKRTKKSPF